MNESLEARVAEAMRNPQNVGELENADAVGTVGDSGCGEMLRLWIKYKQENGKRVIDRATFQSFGCETAIAVASLATQMIQGKTAEEALALSGEALAKDLGPLPPMKIHCAQLVEGALRSALQSETRAAPSAPNPPPAAHSPSSPTLLERFAQPETPAQPKKIVFLDRPDSVKQG